LGSLGNKPCAGTIAEGIFAEGIPTVSNGQGGESLPATTRDMTPRFVITEVERKIVQLTHCLTLKGGLIMQRISKLGRYSCLFAMLIFTLCGCATIFHGSTDKINFSSDPSGAQVYVNGQLMGTAPLEMKLESKHTYNIEFRKEGYQNKTVVVTNSVGAGWIVLDVLFGLIPIIVDAATGNWYSLDQEHVNAALEKQQPK
jgi:hypothetical protein